MGLSSVAFGSCREEGAKGGVRLNYTDDDVKITGYGRETLWEYNYAWQPVKNPYEQEHIHLVESIRENKKINRAELLAYCSRRKASQPPQRSTALGNSPVRRLYLTEYPLAGAARPEWRNGQLTLALGPHEIATISIKVK